MTLVSLLTESVRKHGSRPVIHGDGDPVTYAELGRRVAGIEGGLRRLGVGRGDRVALMTPNCPEFVASYFAILASGGVVVPLNAKLKPAVVQYILSDVGAKAIITVGEVASALEPILDSVPTRHVLVVDGEHGSVPEQFGALWEAESELSENDELGPDDHAVYLYTSGTTGKPKGVVLTHGNFVSNLRSVRSIFPFDENDVFLAVLPLYHSFGHAICMLMPVMVGASLVPIPRFSPQATLAEAQRRKVTVFAAVPTMYAMIAQHPEAGAHDLSSVRYSFSGGAALPLPVLEDFETIFGVKIIEGYGHTEASPVVFVNPSVDRRRVGSVGLPIPDVEVKLVDEEGGVTEGAGTGELLVRGPSIMAGYHNLPEATAEAFDDGWLKMRDLFRRDEDGYYYLIDRLVDLIIVGGANVYPREVEEVLYANAKVAEAAVIGVPDDVYGETVKAVVALRPGEEATAEELIEYCSGRLASYKLPRQVELRDELPKTSTGKISKKELR